MPTTIQEASRGISRLTSGLFSVPKVTVPEFPQASYYRARYYDLNAGRFLTEDPLGFPAGPNFYRFVKNNPTSFADPFGLQQEDSNWFYRHANRFLGWLLAPPKPKPGTPQPKPINICNPEETAILTEAGPNPYYKGGAGLNDWIKFQADFGKKCDAAKKPGMIVRRVCTQGVGVLGPFAYCMCCESCENKK